MTQPEIQSLADVLLVIVGVAIAAFFGWGLRNRHRFGERSSAARHAVDFGDNPACVEAPGPGNGWGSLAGQTFDHREKI